MTERIFSSPRMGIYTDLLAEVLKELGLNYVPPPPVTQKTIKLGVRHSSDMICFPFKTTLGSQIEALDAGATDLLMFDTLGNCRFTNYHYIHKQILEDLGYKFNMHVLSKENYKDFAKKIGCDKGFLKLSLSVRKYWKKMVEAEEKHYGLNKGADIKVAIVGEIYTLLEPAVNYDIVTRLQKMGVGVKVSLLASDFLKHTFVKEDEYDDFKEEGKQYLNSDMAGHGKQTVWNTIRYCREGYDGIIHLLPLTCMPETTVEMIINRICNKYDVPIYHFPIDENQFEVGFNTRLETFVSLLRRRKRYKALLVER